MKNFFVLFLFVLCSFLLAVEPQAAQHTKKKQQDQSYKQQQRQKRITQALEKQGKLLEHKRQENHRKELEQKRRQYLRQQKLQKHAS